MILTKQCKEDFESLYLSQKWLKPSKTEFSDKKLIKQFWATCLPMQYGVFVDFFDKWGIIAQTKKSFNNYSWYVTLTLKQ